MYKYLQLRSYSLYCKACYGGDERLRKVIYLLLKSLMVKMNLLKGVSHNIEVYKNVSTTLNEDLLYLYTCGRTNLCWKKPRLIITENKILR
jgi:hypothetical protein